MLFLEARKSVWRSKKETHDVIFSIVKFKFVVIRTLGLNQGSRSTTFAYTITRTSHPIAEMSKKIRENRK